MSIGLRIKELRKHKKMKQSEFAAVIGVKQSPLSQMEGGKILPSIDTLSKIIRKFNISYSWLIDGVGSIEAKTLNTTNVPNDIIVATPDTDQQISVPVINIKAAANYVTGFQTQEYIETLEAILLPKSMMGQQQHYAFQIIGDSMHPTIYNNDYILARLLEPSERGSTKENYIHVIVSNSRGIVIKRIKNRLKEEGFIRCKSDNRHHPAFNIENDDILQIFEVKCKLSFNMPDEGYNIYNTISKIEDKIEELEQTQGLIATHVSKRLLDQLKERQKESESVKES